MRRKQFGKLLTISLSDECYDLVEKIANACQMSMGAVIRDSIMYSIDERDAWMAARPRPFDAGRMGRGSPDFKDWHDPVKEVEEDETDER